MEIVKIGKKIWQFAAIRQIYQSFFTAEVFYCTVLCTTQIHFAVYRSSTVSGSSHNAAIICLVLESITDRDTNMLVAM